MRRFFVSPDDLKLKTVELVGDEFHHLKTVTRLEAGENVELLDGQGGLAKATILSIEKRKALLEIVSVAQLPSLPFPHLTLAVCIPKFQTMDLIIQKSAELGVQKLVPLLSERSFVRKDSPVLREKRARWNKISLESCKQCGRSWPMEILDPVSLETFLIQSDSKSSVFLFEGEATQNIKSELSKMNSSLKNISAIIGPEGGFSLGEVALFRTKDLKPVTLGDLVLRVETACIATLSVIKYHFDLMR